MTPLSPGLAQAAIELVRVLQRQALTMSDVVLGLSRIGNMPPADALSLSQTLNWVELDSSGTLRATGAGEAVCGHGNYEIALRSMILDYAVVVAPEWVQNATYGRSRVLAFSSPGVAQILVEAGVAAGIGDDVVKFWDSLASIARGRRDDRLLAVGREGERLTISYELQRTGFQPKWVAVDSNQDGYDVLSRKAAEDGSPLSIEVKATTIGRSARLHLTRNEWEQASDSATHVFHLWDLKEGANRIAVVNVEQMEQHVPKDSGGGEWQEVSVPFAAFAAHFTEYVFA